MIAAITYKNVDTDNVAVFLEGKRAGTIEFIELGGFGAGFTYFPKGKREHGDVYPTLQACKHSLEN